MLLLNGLNIYELGPSTLWVLLKVAFLIASHCSIKPHLKVFSEVLIILALWTRYVDSRATSQVILIVAEYGLRVPNRMHQRNDIVVISYHLLQEEPTGKSDDWLEETVLQVPTQHSKIVNYKLMREVEHTLGSEVHLVRLSFCRVIRFLQYRQLELPEVGKDAKGNVFWPLEETKLTALRVVPNIIRGKIHT